MLELARKENRDEDLVDRTLYKDDSDQTQDCVRRVPELKEPLYRAG